VIEGRANVRHPDREIITHPAADRDPPQGHIDLRHLSAASDYIFVGDGMGARIGEITEDVKAVKPFRAVER
ncbi:MAG: hypothetical protein HOL06_01100, partial [Rhodospirillaceae bacterium]|nr:hypothetical protein [Rhodospirillaceae bacterium]